MAKIVKAKKQFCIHGHDTFVVGRDKTGNCNGCRKPVLLKIRLRTKRKPRKFCKHGHDLSILCRIKNGKCRQCNIEKQRLDPTKDSRLRPICKRGHDTTICGRDKQNACIQCGHERNRIDPTKNSLIKLICINGHDIAIVGRDSTGHCISCQLEYAKKWAETHEEEKIEYAQQYYTNNKERILARIKQWSKDHPDLVSANRMKQENNRRLRIPSWADWDKINEFERNKPIGMTTDHIIPLQGKLIWGLHVSWNLQYLTFSENSRKNKRCNLLEASEWYGKILEKAGLK